MNADDPEAQRGFDRIGAIVILSTVAAWLAITAGIIAVIWWAWRAAT